MLVFVRGRKEGRGRSNSSSEWAKEGVRKGEAIQVVAGREGMETKDKDDTRRPD